MGRPGSSAAMSRGDVLKGSGFSLNQVFSMRSPRRRSSTPRAMVSTSGSSGMVPCLSLSQRLGRHPAALYDQESEPAAPPRQTGLQHFHSTPFAGLKMLDQEAEPAGEECVTRN